jgi:hypothetical protein
MWFESEEIQRLLACPKCKGDIILSRAKDGFICTRCKLLYPIIEDIPNFLIEEAKPWSKESEELKIKGVKK